MSGAIRRECQAFVASLAPLEPSEEDLILLRLAFLGGVTSTLRLLADADPPTVIAARYRSRLSLEAMELVEQVSGVRAS